MISISVCLELKEGDLDDPDCFVWPDCGQNGNKLCKAYDMGQANVNQDEQAIMPTPGSGTGGIDVDLDAFFGNDRLRWPHSSIFALALS